LAQIAMPWPDSTFGRASLFGAWPRGSIHWQ